MTPTERIDALLAARGMSRRQLAVAAGIPTSSFQSAMARGRNLTVEVLQAVAKALDVSPAYLLGQEAEPISPKLQRAFLSALQERMESQLIAADSVDVSEAHGASHPYADVLDGQGTLTLDRLEEIAEELGVPLEYLISGKNDPADRYPFVGEELQHRLDTADARLLDTVHRICGMNPKKAFSEKDWNPDKIDLVREYLKDSQAILKKMIAAIEPPSGAEDK